MVPKVTASDKHDGRGQERVAGAEDDPTEDVAPAIIGAKPVRRRRWEQPVLGVETYGIVWGDERRGDGDAEHANSQDQPDHAHRVGAQTIANLR